MIENPWFFFLHFLCWRSLNLTRFQLLTFPLIINEFLRIFKHFWLWILLLMKRWQFMNILLLILCDNIIVWGHRIIFGNSLHIHVVFYQSLVVIILLSYVLCTFFFEHFYLLDLIWILVVWVVNEIYIFKLKIALGWWTVRIIVFTFQSTILILLRWVFLHEVLYVHIILLRKSFIFVFIILLLNVVIMINKPLLQFFLLFILILLILLIYITIYFLSWLLLKSSIFVDFWDNHRLILQVRSSILVL